ncbi:PrpF domain-containing protein [Cupriavidus numazuensis]|uniref:3-methylitaconate isomerase n=1 Tax=Cupriavidus numazuensis TaxID=221992 RepID=A0ABM8TLZ7_9BURK|nr:PrpF domain-containing protein [Cupriavidus numazuensis]CAG2154291.1 3-methylitaconate isomerase [Cupriavidus numazuensis]
MDQISTPYSYYRGGTSKAAIVLRKDLPTTNDAELKAWILAAYGSPDRRQIDGIGGADILTSKFAVVGPSSRPDADVDYTFFQVGIDSSKVLTDLNCGNISASIGPFAVDAGLVPAVEPVTHVRIHATNFGNIIHASVPVRDGRAQVIGTQHIDGVPGYGAPIALDFRETVGGKTGKLLPTGSAFDRIDVPGIGQMDVSIVDLANLVCYVKAEDVGLAASDNVADLIGDTELMDRIEGIRLASIVALGMAPDKDSAARQGLATPWVSVVGAPANWPDFASGETHLASECDISARLFSRRNMHKAYPGTGSACLAVAAEIAGSIPHQMASRNRSAGDPLRIGHPCGVLTVRAKIGPKVAGQPTVEEASLIRTARRIADGNLYVPVDKLPWLRVVQE